MKQEHQVLWENIERFELDDPAAAFPFSEKLSREAKWSMPFTRLAIAEYKKFLLLCCISPRGASPSQVVDKVWHLHLTYTRNYWDELCSKVLHKQLHHHPSTGGTNEDKKHRDWYRETLELYTEVFGKKPPEDIWPEPSESHLTSLISIDDTPAYHHSYKKPVESYTRLFPGQLPPEILPESVKCELAELEAEYKTSIRFTPREWQATGLIILLLLLITKLLFGVLNPYMLTGPQFLVFMCFLFLHNIGIMLLFFSRMRHKLEKIIERCLPETYTYYGLIELLHGKERALQTAILELVNNQLLEFTPSKKFIIHVTDNSLLQTGNPLLPVLASIAQKKKLQVNTSPDDELSYDDLKHLFNNHAPDTVAFSKIKWWSDQKFGWAWLPYRIVLLLLVIRLVQGVYNNHPVGYLLLGICLFTLVCIFLIYLYSLYIPKQLVNELLHKKMGECLSRQRNMAPNDNITIDFSNRGASALAGLESYALLATTIAILPDNSRVSSDGGGGCGSGGGCGGGCGGGGCGGGCGG